ncbi:MAG: hypothetical protein HND52_18600 [Ignavibacteriae bacterium]|nr:hypothetical protein [Ignavibacteriota bacterium]
MMRRLDLSTTNVVEVTTHDVVLLELRCSSSFIPYSSYLWISSTAIHLEVLRTSGGDST